MDIQKTSATRMLLYIYAESITLGTFSKTQSKIFNLPGFEQVRTNPISGTQHDKCHNDKKEIYVFIMAVLCPVLPTKFDRRS